MFDLHNIKTDWKEIITKILNSKKLGTIEKKLSEEYQNFEGLSEIYPKKN